MCNVSHCIILVTFDEADMSEEFLNRKCLFILTTDAYHSAGKNMLILVYICVHSKVRMTPYPDICIKTAHPDIRIKTALC